MLEFLEELANNTGTKPISEIPHNNKIANLEIRNMEMPSIPMVWILPKSMNYEHENNKLAGRNG